MARFIPLVIVALLVFTEPGQRIWTSASDWAAERAAEWFTDKLEDNERRRELQERLSSVEPMCDAGMKPEGFEVTGGQAIALVAGEREIDCDLVDLEPMMDAGWWAVHVDAKKPGGCEFSAQVNATTGEVSNRHRSCG